MGYINLGDRCRCNYLYSSIDLAGYPGSLVAECVSRRCYPSSHLTGLTRWGGLEGHSSSKIPFSRRLRAIASPATGEKRTLPGEVQPHASPAPLRKREAVLTSPQVSGTDS